ncbi:hypothetical protein AAGQ96_19745 [Pantoea sp. MBD-2R]|uniref:hypothetical protein n=1 Tax=unclassified Pantoea TaxID=2630326 RepID=UPI0011BFDF9E|nr:hypothetical protein [Pantoea sp. CCBC3-3-1]
MKIKIFLFIITFCIAACACSSSEIEQSSAINEKYSRQMEQARNKLDYAIKNQVDNNPEKKDLIIALKDAWERTNYYKCQLESFDSLKTQAEGVEVNDCLTHQYLIESQYFNNLLP